MNAHDNPSFDLDISTGEYELCDDCGHEFLRESMAVVREGITGDTYQCKTCREAERELYEDLIFDYMEEFYGF